MVEISEPVLPGPALTAVVLIALVLIEPGASVAAVRCSALPVSVAPVLVVPVLVALVLVAPVLVALVLAALVLAEMEPALSVPDPRPALPALAVERAGLWPVASCRLTAWLYPENLASLVLAGSGCPVPAVPAE